MELHEGHELAFTKSIADLYFLLRRTPPVDGCISFVMTNVPDGENMVTVWAKDCPWLEAIKNPRSD